MSTSTAQTQCRNWHALLGLPITHGIRPLLPVALYPALAICAGYRYRVACCQPWCASALCLASLSRPCTPPFGTFCRNNRACACVCVHLYRRMVDDLAQQQYVVSPNHSMRDPKYVSISDPALVADKKAASGAVKAAK